MQRPAPRVLPRDRLDELFQELRRRGFTLVGPRIREAAIVLDVIEGVADLPEGWTDEQEAGTYRLKRRDDEALFGYVAGPHSWKRFLHEPRITLWRARRGAKGFEIEPNEETPPRYAFIGVRACDLAAIGILDRVLMENAHPDPHYAMRRRDVFLVAVQCGESGATCFCHSMGTGPRATHTFDLALTELLDEARHEFVVEIGTEAGGELLGSIATEAAGAERVAASEECTREAVRRMGRRMDPDAPALLKRGLESPRWEETAQRCLACMNCTMVCPTCFCSSLEDVTDLAGNEASRVRAWDSCFNLDFSKLHGGSARVSIASRYRQWITHKLSTWHDQFDSTGCVGCGRCITWCPVGIDITEEVAALRNAETSHGSPLA